MASDAVIVFYREASPSALHLARMAELWGIPCRMTRIGCADDLGTFLARRESAPCVMVSARALAAIIQDKAMPPDVVAQICERVPFVFVYGVTPGAQETYTVRYLTDGLVPSVVNFDRSDYFYQVSSTNRDITHEFSGLAFGPIHQEIDFGLVLHQPQSGFSTLVSINNLPVFASLKKQNAYIFFLACRDLADVASHTDGSLSAQTYFSRIVPALMFLRHVFRDHAWHSPRQYANFIIDDPLLRKSYGFLNYSRLLEEMDRCEFATTLAFIPWNYRRTHTSIARLIRERSDRFSICIHGCDHSAGEFASTDLKQLSTQTRLAAQRMQAHEQSTGVPYADVMVFPQGKFSTTSLDILKSHNYLAAVNSSVVPQDLGAAHGLTVADLLAPAVTKYSSFPLFMRRYPREVADVAFDLFLGKAVLLVEHHNYFKDGYGAIRAFITHINSLSQRLHWTSLRELLSNTYLQRRIAQDIIECKIFTNHQVIHNPEPIARRYIILKHEDEETSIKHVFVDGMKYSSDITDNHIRLCVDIPPQSSVVVTIDYSNLHEYHREVQNLKRNAKVYLRRYLSEFRDNYLYRHDWLLSLVHRVKK
jgi:hypothetical protein